MSDSRKNMIIVFLSVSGLCLIILLCLSSAQTRQIKQSVSIHENTSLPTQQTTSANEYSSIQKENVCLNFLETYYTVSHSKSETSALTKCRPFLTERLYNDIQRSSEGEEYSEEEVSIDYSSSISTGAVYQNSSNSNEIIVRCTIKRTINKLKSRNEYFVVFNVKYDKEQWLIDDFNLISVMGD